jgi:CheY-like chemotaxis protein
MVQVLVVDDNPAVRQLARAMLEHGGFEVAEAGDGDEAVRAFRGRPAGVVLVEVFMPIKDGLETIRELRALDPGVKVVAMSGGHAWFPGLNPLCLARAFGAAETLCKPFDRLALVEAVERAMGRPAVP